MKVGALGSPRRADVRGGGTVVVGVGTVDEVAIDWWVGADDRWHLPEREITTRQHLVRNMPIVQTSVRIPSGDAVATAYGVVQGPRELVVLDVENRSKVPFALAIVLRGPGVRDVSLAGGTVRVGGFPLVHLPRAPQRSACVRPGEDLESVVTSGAAGVALPVVAGPSSAAFLLPVTHSTTLRLAVLLGATSAVGLAGSPVLAGLPEVHSVANGWGTQLSRGAVVRLPDSEMSAWFETLSAAVLLAAEPLVVDPVSTLAARAAVAGALDLLGFAAESGALLEDLADRQSVNGALGAGDDRSSTAAERAGAGIAADVATTGSAVFAAAMHAALTNDRLFADTMAPTVGGALEFVMKQARRDAMLRPWTAVCRSAADLFTVAGDGRAAKQCMRAWESFGSPWPVPAGVLPPLPALAVGGSLVPTDPRRLAGEVRSLMDSVVRVDADGCVSVLGGYRPEWRGQSIEVRHAATPSGRLSFAIRWHGANAALLWDVVGPADAEPLRLRAPALDPAWRGLGARGDALLQLSV